MNKSSQKSSRKFIGEGALLLMTILWGGTFVIVKEALNDISTLLFVGLRFGIAAVVLFLVLYLKKIKIDKAIILPGVLLGLWLFLGFLTQTAGLKFTSASKSGFLTGSFVVMIPLFQTIIEKKIPSRGALIGTALVFLGIVFLSSGGNSLSDFFDNLGKGFNIGDWLTLMCGVFFALHVVFMDILSPKYEFWNLLFFQLVTVAILNLFFSLIFSYSSIEPLRFSLSNNLIIGILYTALLATLVNFGLQTKYQKIVSPTKAGIIYSFEPVFAAVFAFFILNEKITNFGLVGSALIFLGLIISEVFDSFFSQNDENLELQTKMKRAEILVNGFVQGVGFRYFVVRMAEELGLKGYTKNLFSGEVYTIVEGEHAMIEDFYNKIKIGPVHANVKNASIQWSEFKNEFSRFEVRY